MNERNLGNFLLNEAKNVGDAKASARLFNEVQERIYRLQPFDAPQNKSKKPHKHRDGFGPSIRHG